MQTKTTYISFDGEEFDDESECREYEKRKVVVNITKEMTEELNKLLKEQGCLFNFRFGTYLTNPSIGVIYPQFISNKFLHFNSECVIDANGDRFIRKFFNKKGIDWLIRTSTNGYMAYQYDGVRY